MKTSTLHSALRGAQRFALLCGMVTGLGYSAGLTAQGIDAAADAELPDQVMPLDEIVAVVDEGVIMRSELDQAVNNIVNRIESQGEQQPPRDLLEKQVLENMIISRLEVQRAEQTNIRVSDADVDQQLSALAAQNNITVDQLRLAIERDGTEFSEFRQSLKEDIMSQRLRQRFISSIDVSDTEIDILLASDDLSGGEYLLSHILIGLPDGATPQQVEEAASRADEVYGRLEEGLDFASAAISFSSAQDALNGGELGWVDLNSMDRFLADALEGLSPGDFSEPVRSPYGFHILKVNDFRERRQVMQRELHALHMLIETNELVSAREAMDTIRDLKRRIDSGEDFGDLAREYSDDTSSANIGGDMGWFPPDAFGPRLQQTLEALSDGEVSEPFQTQAGWHIVQRLGARETDRTADAQRAEARDRILQRKSRAEVEKFLRQMREEAYVDIRLPS